jgi:hypothetical protein
MNINPRQTVMASGGYISNAIEKKITRERCYYKAKGCQVVARALVAP